jgi:glucose/arabinose dehydrogenase
VEIPSTSWAGPAPGDRAHLYVASRSGTIRVLDQDNQPAGLLLDLRKQVSRGPEQGLLGVAFDPAYPKNHRLYVDFTDTTGATRVQAYTVADGVATRPQDLLTIPSPYPNHNGGHLLFDRSGMLLVGTGDGGNAGDPQNVAQAPTSLLGKLLRVDPRTGRPATGNPYPQNSYVWALGLRNPGRFVFDDKGYMYLPDVGQNKQEELDVVPPDQQRGANYGWSVYEGTQPFLTARTMTSGGPVVWPALTYSHEDGSCSIAGGDVYRGTLIPWLRGSYVYGDYCHGRLLAVRRTATGLTEPTDLGVHVDGLLGFGLDQQGELLVLSLGAVWRLVPGA